MALGQLQQLTLLGLLQVKVDDLQHLTALTALHGLSLMLNSGDVLTASMLHGMQQLTWLHVETRDPAPSYPDSPLGSFNPSCLAAVTNLKTLLLAHQITLDSTTGVAALLSHLAQLTQLTCL